MTFPVKTLIVDDEPDVQCLFRQRFRRELRAGILEFHFAHSGDEALHYLREGGAANLLLVLSDINMPGMTGLELLRQIKAEFAALQVRLITAYDDERHRALARAYGADGYQTKPLDFSGLKREVFGLA